MSTRAIGIAFLPLLFSITLIAQDSPVSKGFDHFYNLEFDAAIAAFGDTIQQHPDDADVRNHLAQAILYRAMHRSGALESQFVSGSNPFLRREKVNTTPAEDKAFYDALNKSLDISQARLQHNSNDAGALYTLGIAYGLRANYNFSVHKDWIDALRDATNARKAHNRACGLEPNNADARLIPGLYDYVTGSLPIGYKILGFLGGYHGDRQRGMATLETVARQGKSNRVDAQVLLAVVYRRGGRPQEAIALLETLIREFPRSYLLRFEIVQMYKDLDNKEAALEQVERIRELHRAGAQGYADLPAEKIDLLQGNLPKPYKRQEAN